MSLLLDTNVVSELRKNPRTIDIAVASWAEQEDLDEMWLSVVTILEIELGVLSKERSDSTQGKLLRQWFESAVLKGFEGRILALDLGVTRVAAQLHQGRTRPDRDVQIAATALAHGFTLVTRNVRDFEGLPVPILNPWGASQ
ncbi:MAG: type II toxin-antitoxin system VapC family toxin [Microbacteriaceae bacterium]